LVEPFFTTKPVGVGTGLGMSIVHCIIADHGGTITVASTADAGTTFEILLPPTAAGEGVEQHVTTARPSEGEGRILVVDDDPVIARLVAKILERVGYDVLHLTSPQEVLEMLAMTEPPFDLVITDQTMPGMTGLQLAARIQEWQPGFPVIMTTGYLDLGGAQDPRELGLGALLVKPVEVAVLIAAVARVLEEHRAETNPLLFA
jgi:CheY-like chemotaxis protein